jgi:hypothetical protein
MFKPKVNKKNFFLIYNWFVDQIISEFHKLKNLIKLFLIIA